MAYRVENIMNIMANALGADDLEEIKEFDNERDDEALEKGLNMLEDQGWTLVAVVEQRQSWSASDGLPNGFMEQKFVFHKEGKV